MIKSCLRMIQTPIEAEAAVEAAAEDVVAVEVVAAVEEQMPTGQQALPMRVRLFVLQDTHRPPRSQDGSLIRPRRIRWSSKLSFSVMQGQSTPRARSQLGLECCSYWHCQVEKSSWRHGHAEERIASSHTATQSHIYQSCPWSRPVIHR